MKLSERIEHEIRNPSLLTLTLSELEHVARELVRAVRRGRAFLAALFVVACGGQPFAGFASDAGELGAGGTTSSSGGARTSTGGELGSGGHDVGAGGATSSSMDAGPGYFTTDGKECNGVATNCRLTQSCEQYPTLYVPCCLPDHRCGCLIGKLGPCVTY